MKPDLEVVIEIPRPPAEVRAWWLEMPADYVAADPKEQPHRIVTLRRDATRWETITYWRVPGRANLPVRETFTFRDDGWDVLVELPFGLEQRDEFALTPTPEGTRVRIRVGIWPRNLVGRLARPAFLRYARRAYPATWRRAATICARDAPRLAS